MIMIDLRSDTVTAPTDEMRQAMANARVGDDVYGDDFITLELEKYAAEISGKEAALFIPTGTFGNQLALFTHCCRGDEVLLGDDCHIVAHEVGASSVIAGVQLRTLNSCKGMLDPEEISRKIRGKDIHFPATGLICLENAHSNGRVIPLENMQKVYNLAKQKGIPVHLDGARLFNAAVYLGVDAREITTFCDSVMFCLSKGLCAPIGSMLAGSHEFIKQARKKRKLMGGGMRQVGVLAAPGLLALQKMRFRLADDHENALLLGRELARIPGIHVFEEDIHINMVFFSISQTKMDPEILVEKLMEKGIQVNGADAGLMRFVTHKWVSQQDVYRIITIMRELLQ